MKPLLFSLKQIPWYQSLRNSFLINPNCLLAVKATASIGMLVIAMLSLGKPFYAVTLGLGALAGALSETNDNPNGRLKSTALKVVSFAISSFCIEWFLPTPMLLAIWLALSTIIFILIGGISERFRGIAFGALLIGVYTMIGAPISPDKFTQPILLTLGALVYGVFSYIILLLKPYSLIKEELARGFSALSVYLEEKTKLFPSNTEEEKDIRANLALLNVQIVEAMDSCKEVLNSYNKAIKNKHKLQLYLHYFIVLQSLHERATSSHDRYDVLSVNPSNDQLIGGIKLLLHELSNATQDFAESLLIGSRYKHPENVEWLTETISELSEKNTLLGTHPIKLLIRNLIQSHDTLKNIYTHYNPDLLPKLQVETRTYLERLKEQLHIKHPRMRHALRLSVAVVIAYAFSEYFSVNKGEWIVLTVLLVLQPSFSETRRRLLQRTLGTLAGVVIGVLIIRFFSFSGQILLMLASAYLFFIWLKRHYAVSVIFITIFVLCSFDIVANTGINMMPIRLYDTLIGAAISFVVVRFLWPEWQYKKLPSLLSDVINKNTAYFNAILKAYKNPTNDDLAYRIARREAHRADNALVLAWQNMQLDPQKQQQLNQTAFVLTYLNHTLLSYLSALGAHRNQQNAEKYGLLSNDFQEEEAFILSALDEAFKWLTTQNDTDIDIIEANLETISNQLQNKSNTAMQQTPYVLLCNIAQVTLQILEQAKLFKLNDYKK